MRVSNIKNDLLSKIQQMDDEQAECFYGLLLNYLADMTDDTSEEWDSLSSFQEDHIERSIVEAGSGQLTPLAVTLQEARAKYGS